MHLELSCNIYLELTPDEYSNTSLPVSLRFIKRHNIILDLPTHIKDQPLRGVMDKLLYKLYPFMQADIYNYYTNKGGMLIELYGIKGCKVIDNNILTIIKYCYHKQQGGSYSNELIG